MLQIVPLLRDEHEWVRDNAARTLAKIGPCAEAAVPILQSSLNDESRYEEKSASTRPQRLEGSIHPKLERSCFAIS